MPATQQPKVETNVDIRMRTVREMFDGGEVNDEMKQFPIFFIAGNIFCKASNIPIDERNPRSLRRDIYYPMEIGIVRYTIAGGIDGPLNEDGEPNPFLEQIGGTDKPGRFHRNINPGEIVTGYSASGLEHSKETHCMPLWPCVSGSVGSGPQPTEEYNQMMMDIKTFCNESFWPIEGKEKLVMYTLPGMANQMMGMIKYMAELTKDQNWINFVDNQIFIAEASDLLLCLMKIAGETLPRAVCIDRLLSSQYDFTDGKE